ncbi:hypothetical protein BUALT_Bualt16G0001900 [Buddleja alternifolia]|uniref:Transmembrane protein n=1 Tax=Buddleja alternifolia TaxID=168488 RepID=A0AAV6WH45_9LAMI|nr:hypothetical protein BUALT_Bualt16G0001900 [Buddleja alternifolia]
MSDWGPVFVAVVLFVVLTPGLLIQLPGRSRFVEFGNFQTSALSILVHAILYFALISIFLLAIGIEMYVKNDEEEKKKQTIDNIGIVIPVLRMQTEQWLSAEQRNPSF